IGNAAFHDELARRDPEMAEQLKPGDGQRMLRAWEVLEASGRSLSFWQRNEGRPVLDGLRLARFRAMLADGAMEEALALADLDPALPAARIIGRRELLALHEGSLGKEEAI